MEQYAAAFDEKALNKLVHDIVKHDKYLNWVGLEKLQSVASLDNPLDATLTFHHRYIRVSLRGADLKNLVTLTRFIQEIGKDVLKHLPKAFAIVDRAEHLGKEIFVKTSMWRHNDAVVCYSRLERPTQPSTRSCQGITDYKGLTFVDICAMMAYTSIGAFMGVDLSKADNTPPIEA